MLIDVKLFSALAMGKHVRSHGFLLQNTTSKHQGYRQFSLERHVQLPDLGPWQDEHPHINGDVDSGVPISKPIDIEASTLMLTIPALPEKVQWSTLRPKHDVSLATKVKVLYSRHPKT